MRISIYDSIFVDELPKNAYIAVYGNGIYAANLEVVKKRKPKKVLTIDVIGNRPDFNMLDIETFDATPQDAPPWVRKHVDHFGIGDPHVHARLYCNLSTWPLAKAQVAQLPWEYRQHVRWHIANPTGVPHLVPGSTATQWYWGKRYDQSLAHREYPL